MENQDLLNLCRLNLMEEHIEDGIDCADKTTELKTIDYAKRQLVSKIIRTAPEATPEIMAKHIKDNTSEGGYYPWTTDPKFQEVE